MIKSREFHLYFISVGDSKIHCLFDGDEIHYSADDLCDMCGFCREANKGTAAMIVRIGATSWIRHSDSTGRDTIFLDTLNASRLFGLMSRATADLIRREVFHRAAAIPDLGAA